MTDNNLSSKNTFKRRSLRVLTPKILKPLSDRLKEKELISVSGFIRERIIMRSASESSRRAQKARKLDIPPDQIPLPDPVWRKYRNSSLNLEKFDIKGCVKDDNLFQLGREFVEQVNAAEIGPDDGIPINEKISLPRSFLLDSIHLAASQHCIYMQKKLGKPIKRSECPSPAERAKPFNGINEYYRTSIKIMTGKMKRNWIKFRRDKSTNEPLNEPVNEPLSDNELSNEEEEGEGLDDNEADNSAENEAVLSATDPDFDAILAHLLDIPNSLDPVPLAYKYPDVNNFGADTLWSFDTSALLTFGILAEEFIERMINIHLAKEADKNVTETVKTIINQEDESLLE